MNEYCYPDQASPFTAISAEEYETFHKKIIEQENKNHPAGIGLKPSSRQCVSIEILCSGLSIAILEVFAGRRPAHHLAKWLSKECLRKITARAQVTTNTLRQRYTHSPLRATPFRQDLHRPKTRRVRAQQISTEVFEVSLILEDAMKVRAMALRVEKIFKAWKITAVEIA